MFMALKEVLGEHYIAKDIRRDENLAKYTSFKIGGNADTFIDISNIFQLQKLIPYLNLVETPYFILGKGTNTLVSDSGFPGVVLHIGSKFCDVRIDGEEIYVRSGALISETALMAAHHSLTGMEFAAGIPGSIGGAAVMNAGAYDGEMSKIIESVEVIDPTGQVLTLDNKTMEFSYRSSVIKKRDFCVCGVTLRLKKGDEAEIREKMRDFALKRMEKQPLEYPSAGSVFKRPPNAFAGKLIMDAGLSGHVIGGAAVSAKHCGFIVNIGNATAKDVHALIDLVQTVVGDRSGVNLEPEVVFLGDS